MQKKAIPRQALAVLAPAGLALLLSAAVQPAAAIEMNPFLAPGYETDSASGLPSINGPRQPAAATAQAAAAVPPLSRAEIAQKQQSAFGAYVETVTGQTLPVFGSELFQSAPRTFTPLEGVQVNGDYVLGPGDEIQIRGWGMVDIDLTVTVDRAGSIYLPRVGAVKVAGVKYRDLQGYLKTAVGRVFTNFDLSASVAQTRAVQVYVVGHAVRPGTYTLGAMSSLLNALFSSGGPSGTGSMRNIQVKRGGAVVTTFDLYDMLVHGDKSKDVSLQDGDVIHIPEVGPLVALSGDVKRPAIYELKGSSSIADVVEWAGGLEAAAERKDVIVEKNSGNRYQTVAELRGDKDALRQALGQLPLAPSNVIRVFSPGAVPVVAQKQREFVRVGGEAAQTGVFQIAKGETLRELVARLGGVNEDGYVFATRVTRDSVRRAQQAKLDEIADRFEREIESIATQRVAGTTDKDNVANIQAEVERQRRLAQKMRSVKADGRIVLELEDGRAQVKNLPDLPLQDGDSVYIPRRPGTVEVLGAVYQQNSFIYKPGRTVSDYLAMAGGPSQTGDKGEMYVIRADGTVDATGGWLGGVGGSRVNPGDTVVVPEKIERSSWTQSVKEWTTILYQFGLGAAGLKVLKD
ncbi:protein involved in polysaccharide export with SLBB domain [Crenobacter luteus]|uniref:SLBB domain-containing protein n=1 Tax=Crenobacter luteus TaxID=1452487 RepID=UPI0010EFA79F|nr:SLBB domain-containing protein [Crenobacter luteus]TCP10528.1 protein involved in polysaccharide export with SLBB domain [Crenobacter luteus]